jgi:prepilin signal peptidase PulO-like enzyme (type II secretory pathway)
MLLLTLLFLFYFGCCIGSFLNVVTMRLPHGESLNGRSHCPHCGHTLGFFELFPLFSYLALRGKCKNCKAPIHRRYVYLEVFTGLLTVLTYSFFPAHDAYTSLVLARALVIVYALIPIFLIDLEHYLILDSVLFWAVILTAVCSGGLDYLSGSTGLHSSLLVGLISGAAISLFFLLQYALSKGTWIGLGDVKFGIFLGLATPYPSAIATLLLAYGIGAVVGIVLLAARRKQFSSQVPFGTFLALGSLLSLYYGKSLSTLYLHAIGIK